MANKRRKGQCMDFAVGGLKRLAYDEKVTDRIRLRALELMLKIDNAHPEGSQADSDRPETTSTLDPLLESLRVKHGGDNADSKS